jgi:hypothetical protein
MHSLITSYLLQSKQCILPGIGVLQILHTPASTDIATNRILPPFEEIIFKKEDHSKSPGFVKFIADKKNIEQSEAEGLLNDFCNEWKEKIKTGEKLNFENIGTIQTNVDGVIVFEKENTINFFQPISVNDTYHRTELPEPIIDKQTQPELYEEVDEDIVVQRSYWGLWALILLVIGAVMIFYHFKEHGISRASISNQHQYPVDSAGATYTIPNN